MESLESLSCKDFASVLAAKEPVPGGGGASAYVGALGIALCGMVGEYTVGKKKYAAVEEDVKKIMAEAEELRIRFLQLVEEDATAFEPLSRAYGIPKDDPKRPEILESCIKAAVKGPFEMVKLSCRALDLLSEITIKGSKLIISDAGTGACFCRAALLGAALNVKVNTKLLLDRELAETLDRETDELTEKYSRVADEIYANTLARMYEYLN